jgi:hypothetical protein
MTPDEQNEFTKAANNSRNFAEGVRHASNPPQLPKPLIPFNGAYIILNKLILGWLNSKR